MSRTRTSNGAGGWLDQGPASASAVTDPVAAMGALSATGLVGSGAPTGGAGPIERRPAATEPQRDWNGHGPRAAGHAPQMPQDAPTPANGASVHPTAYARLAEAAARADEAMHRKLAADLAWVKATSDVRLAWLACQLTEVDETPEPDRVQPPPERPSTGLTNEERMAQSRRNGQASMRKVVTAKPKGTNGQKRTPEQRERMRQGQLAAIERRKAAAEAEA